MTRFEAVGVFENASHPPSEKSTARATIPAPQDSGKRKEFTRSWFGDGILRARGDALVGLQGFIGEVDGLLQLRVVAADDEVGALRHFVVGIDAVVFHDPLAAVVRGPKRKLRRGHAAAVAQ